MVNKTVSCHLRSAVVLFEVVGPLFSAACKTIGDDYSDILQDTLGSNILPTRWIRVLYTGLHGELVGGGEGRGK